MQLFASCSGLDGQTERTGPLRCLVKSNQLQPTVNIRSLINVRRTISFVRRRHRPGGLPLPPARAHHISIRRHARYGGRWTVDGGVVSVNLVQERSQTEFLLSFLPCPRPCFSESPWKSQVGRRCLAPLCTYRESRLSAHSTN